MAFVSEIMNLGSSRGGGGGFQHKRDKSLQKGNCRALNVKIYNVTFLMLTLTESMAINSAKNLLFKFLLIWYNTNQSPMLKFRTILIY